jgi:glycosyltransferase involved in cell wall biosynthesis
MPGMNILMVFHAPPFPPDLGPSRRHFHELSELLDRGHRVSVLSYGCDEDRRRFIGHFGSRCLRVRFVPLHVSRADKLARRAWAFARGRSDLARLLTRRLQRALDEMVAADQFDVVSFSTTMLGGLRLPTGVPMVGDTHNIEFDNLRRAFDETRGRALRAYFRLQAALTRREETRYTRRFHIVCTTSARDRRVLQAAVPGARIEVVPNGVALDAFTPEPRDPEPGTLLFTGLMSYYPNAHGIRRFLDEVFPRIERHVPAARALVVGAEPPPALARMAGPRVEITGYVPDVRPYLRRAQVYVVPLHIGGGTRVKVLQAMAAAVPVVSTTLGCEGLDVEDGRHVLLADDAETFAEAVVRLLGDARLREALARRAREHVRRYDWGAVGDLLNDVFSAAARMRTADAARPAFSYAADPR